MQFRATPPTQKSQVKLPKIPLPLIIAIVVIVLILVFFIFFPPFVMVPTGHTAVVTTFGRVEDYVLDEGFHLKSPMQKIMMIDNRAQKATISMQAFSSDIQQVEVDCSVNFTVDRETSQNLYKNVGMNYYNTVMLPRIMENTKAVFTRYSAEKLMEVRNTLSSQIKELLAPEMKKYGIEIVSIAIENVDFTDAFTDAVEAKQVAEQTKLKVETEQAQQVSMEKSAAERKVITANANAQEREILANADAAVVKIQADAAAYQKQVESEAEATANEKIAKSLTGNLIKYMEISQWDGALPKISGTSEIMPIIGEETLSDTAQ